MTKLTGIAAALLIVAVARMLSFGGAPPDGADAAMALGFVLVVSFLAGDLGRALGLPRITGYILTGVLFGPFAAGLVTDHAVILSREAVSSLKLVDGMALGLIALTAGGELKLSILRARWKTITAVGVLQVVFVMLFVGLGLCLLAPVFPGLAGLSPAQTAAAAAILGAASVANSPATTIAIIQETGAKGPVAENVLGTTVFMDFLVLIVFIAVLGVTVSASGAAAAPPGGFASILAWEVGGSLAVGIALAFSVKVYMERVGREMPLVVIAIAFVSVAISDEVHLSGLLVCMTAGFFIENFTRHGEGLIKAVERHSMPVYVLFFTIAGAMLDINALVSAWHIVLFISAARFVSIFLATSAGAGLTGAGRMMAGFGWTGFASQAGVSIGLASIVEKNVPGMGADLSTILIGVIAVNQVIGPVVFKLGLKASGEIADSKAAPIEDESAKKTA